MAGGFSINVEKINQFREFVFKKFNSNNENLSKDKPIY